MHIIVFFIYLFILHYTFHGLWLIMEWWRFSNLPQRLSRPTWLLRESRRVQVSERDQPLSLTAVIDVVLIVQVPPRLGWRNVQGVPSPAWMPAWILYQAARVSLSWGMDWTALSERWVSTIHWIVTLLNYVIEYFQQSALKRVTRREDTVGNLASAGKLYLRL